MSLYLVNDFRICSNKCKANFKEEKASRYTMVSHITHHIYFFFLYFSVILFTFDLQLRPPSQNESFQWLSYLTVCLMKRSGSWAVKVVSRDPAGRPSSSLMDLGLGLNSGLSLMSRIRIETVAVDCRGGWMPRASVTSFSASTVSMKERVSSKSMGWREEGWDEIIVT